MLLAAELSPGYAVLALATRPGTGGAVLAGGSGGVSLDVARLLAREKAKGEPGEVVVHPVLADGPLERVLLAGTGTGLAGGEAADPSGSPTSLRRFGAAVARRASGSTSLAVDLRGVALTAAGVRAIAEGVLLASYGFTLKTSDPRALAEVTLVVDGPAALQVGLDRALITARATAAARDLVNTPSLTKTPQWLAEQATELLAGLSVRVLDDKQLVAGGFGGIVGVGQGSTRGPRLIEARYDGGAGPTVALIGKGITFDTGGLSLKPTEGMLTMKTDMGGAAAVLGALRAAADLALPLRIVALVAAAENMPSGTASRPGDVLHHYGGRTSEVLNTDAEGRLVLADALAYAHLDLAADLIVDVATLTGAMPIAMGRRHAGLFSSDDALAHQLLGASAASGERAWRMPLVADYRFTLDSPTADLRNIGDPRHKLGGGSITAALFLQEFTGGRPWAHLDIAGPGRSEAEEDELTKGGTGYGVRLLTYWLEALSGHALPA